MTVDNEGPLSRWSRRKAETREKENTVEDSDAAAPSFEEESAALPVQDGATTGGEAAGEEAAPPDLPDIDSLTAESDFSVFMQAGVPDKLRKLALRKLWRSDPVLANLDGMLEYGEDFTDAADAVDNLQTAYQVGKGYKDEEPDAPEDTAAGDTEAMEDLDGDVAPLAAEDEADPEAGEEGEEEGEEVLADTDEREPDPSAKSA